MRIVPASLFGSVLVLGSAAAQASRPDASPFAVEQLQADVAFLASPKLRGRMPGTAESRKCAAWIAARFEKLGLKPAVDGGWYDEFKWKDRSCRNVAGIVEVEGARDYVVVGAHYDHKGMVANRVMTGADDNASGVAGMLALAAWCSANKANLRRHVVFVSYDAEEQGLAGSRAFVKHGVVPSERTKFMLVFDLIGGVFLPGEEKQVYAFGSEHSKAVRKILEARAKNRPISTRILGTYLLEPVGPAFARSDYAAYRRIHVPYLFLTTGTPWYYHSHFDTKDRLDYAKLAAVAKLARDVLLDVATAEAAPDWVEKSKPEMREAHGVAAMLASMVERKKELGIDAKTQKRIERQLARVRKQIEAGELTRGANRLLQQAVISVLQVSRAYWPPDK